ncbi:MAG: DUF4347 domain-containing protein, partial [Gammaproteobacteria bacterium]|nr:DUF4347 domain-containing protein [Gammaproteobacteria bacterium]
MKSTTGVWLKGLGAGAMRLRQRAYCSVRALRGSLQVPAAPVGKRTLERLEPRILLSADPLSSSLDSLVNDDHDSRQQLDSFASIEQLADNLVTDFNSAADFNPANDDGRDSGRPQNTALDLSQLNELLAAQPLADVAEQRQEIIFVDTATPDYQTLIDGIVSSSATDYQIIAIDRSSDGIAIISDYLNGAENIDAVHLVSHGKAGGVQLGNTWLDQASLGEFADLIASWSTGLNSDADLLIYGCNLAADASGQDLLQALAELTGADVAASDDLTGATELGGDWELEFQLGSIQTDIPFSLGAQLSWSGVLSGSAQYADSFSSVAYSNSDGLLDWSGNPWVESGDDGNASSGRIQIVNFGGDEVLRIEGGGISDHEIERSVDHPVYANGSLELEFSYQRQGMTDATDWVRLQTSADGVSWNTVYQFDNTGGGNDPGLTQLEFDISNYASRTTYFRFISSAFMDVGSYLYIDDFEVEFNDNTLWLSTESDVVASGVPGQNSWSDSDILNFAPDIGGLGTTTSGTVGWVMDLDGFLSLPAVNVDALHYVGADLSLGSGASTVDLQAGDVLFSLDGSDLLSSSNSLFANAYDVVRFRPDSVGDYSAGEFELVFSQPDLADIIGLSLVEQDTTVGDVLLNQGSFIVAIDKSIFWNTMGDISADATDVTSQMLVDGKEDFGFGKLFSDKLDGLELIESATVVGGVSLNAGDILASTKGSNGVNLDINSQAGTSHDIYALSLTKTILGSGTTSGTVALFFDGTDINLDVSGENIDAITLYNSAAANNLPTGSVTITGTALEDQTLSVDTSSLADADGLGTFNYQWLRDGSPISGADSSTYALDDADVGALMSVEVSYTDGGGTAELVTSAETVAVVNVNDAPTFTTTALTPSYTAGGAAVSLFSGTAIDTIESGDTISGFVLTVSNVSDTTEYLAIDGLDIALSNGNSGTTTTNSLGYSVSVTGTTATVTISGGAMTSTTAEGVFNAITYRNSSSELSFGSRSVTVVSITDSGGTANGGVETSSPGLTAKVIMPTHYADYFSSVAYDNSDGSIDWSSSPWVESGDDGSVGSGAIKVTTLGADDVLQIGGGAGSVQLERVITHTSDANGSLELKFNYQRDNFSDGDDKVYLEISADGVSWSTAHTFDNSGGGSDASPTTLDFSITNYASRTTWFRFNTDAGLDAGAALYIDDFEVGYNANTLWLSTAHNVPSPSGTTGLDSWNDSDVINFDPSANGLGADSGGNFGWAFDIDNFSASNNADISALHYVTADISVGAGTPINLLEGDVLLSLWSSDTLTSSNSLAVGIDDVVRFRPDVAGDYSAGTFELLFSHPGNWGISGISLVEADTTVADVELQKGTFLITDLSGGKRYDIQVYTPGDLSVDPHDGTLQTLINGKDSPVPSKWLFEDGPLGLELLEVGYTIGGQTFNEGTILVATDGNVGVYLDNTVVGTSQDIYALNMTQTTLGSGNNAGAVSLFLDGSDVGLDTWAEGIDAFSFYHSQVATNSLPSGNVVVTGTVMEDQTLSADTSGLADADGLGSFTYQWQRDGSDISGATASTYVLDDADVGATMTVAVRYTDAGGTIEDVTSAATVAVVNVNDAPTFTTNALSPTYTEGGAAVNLFSSTDIDAVESGDTISGFVLTVANVNDFLEIINVDGIDITLTNGTSGSTGVNGLTFNVSVVGSTATLTISGGAMTSTAAENVFNAITYRNTNNDPTTGNRTVTVSSVTDSGGTANGGVDTATPGLAATVTVAAANDRPTANAVAVNADEDGTTVSGSFSVSDVDSGDSHTFDITSAPAEGSVINNNDGTFTFDPGTDFQDLADGETRDVTFNYTATDNSGAANDTSTAATVTVTVTGTNDQPVAGAVAINADEDGATVDGSFVLASDADSSDSHTFDITSTPSEGSVVNNGDGTFTFDPGTDFQDLAEGETRNVTFNYTVVDDSGTGNATSTTAIVTVTVTGSNDRPTASAVAINADEDGATVNGAFVLGSDADIADSHTFAITSSPAEGSVINNNDGTFTFDPGSDFQDLAEGETRDVTFNYTVTDDSGESNDTSVAATVTVTVTGTNDRPTASVIGAGVLSSGATVTDSFLVADSDSNDTHTFAITSSPIEGSVINNNDGTFTFDPGTDFLDLAAGATRDATFTYNATDNSGTANATSTSTVITITVSGVGGNAQPIANAVAIAAVEDSVTVTDNFSVSDADVGDSHTFTITSSPSEGSVINNNDGSFTFDPGSDFQDLAKGETRIVTFDYIAIDNSGWVNDTSTTATVSVTVTGTNDQPTADAVAISADEDGATVDGTFVVAGDADTTDSHTFAITSAPTEGSVVNNNDGTFTFDPGTDFQDLADGETRDVTFTYTAIDDSSTGNATSASATVTITVTGTNDQPSASAVAISADEDGTTVDGTFVLAGDADSSDDHTFDITSAPSEGSVVNNNDGTFTFDPGSDFQDLADGETRDVTFTYTAIDDSGTGNATSTSATVTVTVTGTNDQPSASAVAI